MTTKTTAISIIAVEFDGDMLARVVVEGGVLPGNCLMVPDNCHCVLVAGDKATAAFALGPAELDLMMFNRQPSGLLYTASSEPKTFTWYPHGSPYRRALSAKVADPMKFVQGMVIGQTVEKEADVQRALGHLLDEIVPAGSILEDGDAGKAKAAEAISALGLELLELREELATHVDGKAPTLDLKADARASTAELQGMRSFQITGVWSSSTMDLFGKGELTLRARLIGRTEPEFNPNGPFVYDATQEYLSPNDWLAAEKWQDLPEESLRFEGLMPNQYYRLFLVAEERDKTSVDALGQLETELGQPNARDVELGPTEGGKKGNHVKLRGNIS